LCHTIQQAREQYKIKQNADKLGEWKFRMYLKEKEYNGGQELNQ
jgi:hypothetical protein